MSDRLEAIKETFKDGHGVQHHNLEWLVAEVERLRSNIVDSEWFGKNFVQREIVAAMQDQIESLTKERDELGERLASANARYMHFQTACDRLEAENAELKEELRISQGIKEGSYTAPKEGWTCFHCGITFRKPGAASDHFGEVSREKAKCQYHDLDVEKLEQKFAASEKARKDAEEKTVCPHIWDSYNFGEYMKCIHCGEIQ